MALKIPNERILQHFVDRIQEMKHFQGVLGGGEHRVLWIHGPGGIGKSLLLSRMMDECKKQEVPWSRVEWTASRLYDYLLLMREIRDQCQQPELFQLFNDRVNHLTKPDYTVRVELDLGDIRNVEVLRDGTLAHGGNEIHIGNKIEDLHLPAFQTDRDDDDVGRRTELTEAFFRCYEALLREGPRVLFLDGVERAEAEPVTMAWIQEELIDRVCDGALEGLTVVVAGRNEVEVDPAHFYTMRTFRLKPFEVKDIEEYLRRRGIEGDLSQLARAVMAGAGEGSPAQVAQVTNAFLQLAETDQA